MGKVILVGAGPYDKGLLTVKGLEAIKNAEVILYDRLANPDLLNHAQENCEKINVGKISANHVVPQHEINDLLLTKALENKNVVRLKGGDPYLFGRGGEEIDLLAKNNIEFEIVPGVTSAIAAAAYAGIPVTHRDYVSSLHIITGHAKEGKELEIDFESLVKLKGTLVFMMSIKNLPLICRGLKNAGMNDDFPVGIVENGTSSRQRKVIGTIGNIVERANNNNVVSPAVIIVGQVVTLSDRYDWFSEKKLRNMKVLIASHADSSQKIDEKLYKLGCDTYVYPCTKITPVFGEMEMFQKYQHIIFTSIQGVKYFFRNLIENKIDLRTLHGIKIVAVGVETEKELNKNGIQVDFVPSIYTGEHLAKSMIERINENDKVLIIRAKKGTEKIIEIFNRHHIDFSEAVVYETEFKQNPPVEVKDFDYVTLTSASTVQAFVNAVGLENAKQIKGICIGEMTANTARALGMNVFVSRECTIDSMVELIRELKEHE